MRKTFAEWARELRAAHGAAPDVPARESIPFAPVPDNHPIAVENRRKWRANNVKAMYGLTLEQVEEMYHAQQGKCANAGCCKAIPLEGRGRHIDHDHKTGHVRGILCRSCNVALGMLGEDPKRIVGLIDYMGFPGLKHLFQK